MSLRFFDIRVTDRHGETVGARLACCSVCRTSADIPTYFLVYQIEGHTHFQCCECGTTYCDGTCA
jgi:hypothetical protein